MSAAQVLGEFEPRQIAQLVAWLPADRVARLAKGPVPQGPEGDNDPDGDCRFCGVFDDWKFEGSPGRWIGDTSRGTERFVQSPAQRRRGRAFALLHDWHQGWDVYESVPGFQVGAGPICYERCLMIYRAAGWPG